VPPHPPHPPARRVQAARGSTPVGAFGERPPSPFGGLPISELAILAGAIGVVVGVLRGGGAALIVGVIVCALGVVEVTAREHFSGYRSHAALLAGIPAVAVETGLVLAFGEPRRRALLALAVVPVFALLLWLLRKRFAVARQARMARPPAP
jgi:Ca2+/Na+ antiporter